MKLLLDQNLSHRLIESLQAFCADILHVRSVGLAEADDEQIWQFAGANGLTVVTKDSDFDQRVPPGAAAKSRLSATGQLYDAGGRRVVRSREQDLAAFHSDGQAALLILP